MSEKKTLLVLEDGEKLTQAIRPAFEAAGYEVITYKDATGVLVMARQIQASVMVIDAQLRGAGSVSALKSFARNVHTTAVPAIAVIGRAGPKAAELLAAGARATIDDPVDPKQLLALAEKHRLEELDFTMAPADAVAAPERLASLEATRVLDSPPEDAFDRLTRLVSRLLPAPVSLASFVAADRQFFKSETGLTGKWKERRGTPLSHSFCQWVVTSREPVVIDDARRYRALRSNAAIDDLGVVAYAGVPVVGADGQAIGSMCAIDHDARKWSAEEIETLQDLAIVLQSYVVHLPEHVRAATQAVTRTLRRYGSRLRDDERDELLRIIDEQTHRLAAG